MKCSKCDQMITGVHYEGVEPGAFSSGSKSFVAVATPCNHVIGAVPMTWEAKLDDNFNKTEEVNRRISAIEQNISQIIALLSRNR